MSFFGIIFLSPILLFIAVSVKFTSEGTILYRGERSGLFGKSFNILKFRTMVMNADLGAGTTSRNDKRITYVGNILRRYKLDELPQLINVFFGDMSFVGPRPELQKYTNQYQGEEKLILSVRPGITDFSSVKFSNLNELIDDDNPDASFEKKILSEKNRLRLQYVNECNFWLDIKLIFHTILRITSIK
jgi:lipopolysaccharide/colanic/teichoic acid biosynthesis glycosyltransferase